MFIIRQFDITLLRHYPTVLLDMSLLNADVTINQAQIGYLMIDDVNVILEGAETITILLSLVLNYKVLVDQAPSVLKCPHLGKSYTTENVSVNRSDILLEMQKFNLFIRYWVQKILKKEKTIHN